MILEINDIETSTKEKYQLRNYIYYFDSIDYYEIQILKDIEKLDSYTGFIKTGYKELPYEKKMKIALLYERHDLEYIYETVGFDIDDSILSSESMNKNNISLMYIRLRNGLSEKHLLVDKRVHNFSILNDCGNEVNLGLF